MSAEDDPFMDDMTNYQWFNYFADKYNEGKISLEALKILYIVKTGVTPQEVDGGTAVLL